MEEALYTFDPIKTQLNTDLWMYGIILVALGLLLAYFNKKEVSYEQRTYKQIGLMLGFFAFMIMLGTTFFTYWTTVKIKTVTITKETIETPYGIAKLDNIKNAYFYRDKQVSSLSPDMVKGTTKFLMIEEYGKKKKMHVLSEEHYDIQAVLDALRIILKIEEKK